MDTSNTSPKKSQAIQPQDKGPPNFPKSIWEANPSLAGNLKKEIQLKVTGISGKPHTVEGMTKTTIQLPELRRLQPNFQRLLKENLFDMLMKDNLKRGKVLNWCRNTRPLYPLRTMGDGNCLLHAVSMAMWGIQDTSMFLRRLVYIALVEDEEQGDIKKRWHKERGLFNEAVAGGLNLDSREWEQEWEMVVKAAEDRRLDDTNSGRKYGDLLYECLEEIHIFVLANVLKRPIIVMGESVIRGVTGLTLANNNFRGIYLPLLWKPDECFKTPIILAYDSNHFAPLVSFKDSDDDLAEDACPIVTSDLEMFHVHFLLQHEEGVIHRILQSYMEVTEVTFTGTDGVAMVLAAKMEYIPMPEHQDLIKQYMHLADKQYREYVKLRTVKKSNSTTTTTTLAKAHSTPNKEVVQPLHSNMDELHLSESISGEFNQEGTNNLSFNQDHTFGRGKMDKFSNREVSSSGRNSDAGAFDLQAHVPNVSKSPKPCMQCNKGSANVKYGGQCSTCYASLNVEDPTGAAGDREEPATQGREEIYQEPTAPTQSLVTNVTPSPSLLNTYSWRQGSLTNTLVGPQTPPAPMVEGLSMLPEACQWKGCSNLCSTQTYPHCHEHNQGSHTRAKGTFVKQRSTEETSLSVVPGGEEIGGSQSFEEAFHERGRGVPCREKGCRLYGLPEWDHRCSQHRETGSSYSPTAAAGGNSWQKCRKSGCTGAGNSKYTGFCSSCFAGEEPPLSSGERTPAIRMKITPRKTEDVRKQDAVLPSEREPQHQPAKSTKPLPQSTSFERKLNESKKCIGPNCANIGFDVYSGLCEDCYTLILQQKTSLAGPAVPGRKIRVSSQELDEEVGTEVPASGSPPRCKREGCKWYGSLEHRGFCSGCWRHEQQAGRGGIQIGSGNVRLVEPYMAPSPAAPVEYKVTTGVPIPIPIANQCRASNCDRFGDPGLAGFCSSCYRQRSPQHGRSYAGRDQPTMQQGALFRSHEAPPSSARLVTSTEITGQPSSHSAPIPSTGEEPRSTDQQYNVAMKRLERTIRSSVRQCKIQGCQNFGNPKSRGYCNDCFKMLRPGSPEMAPHRHVRYYRNGGWDECDQYNTSP